MNIQARNHSENQVIISTEDLQKLVEIANKIEPIEITEELSAEENEAREDEFERYLLAKGVISHIAARNETDEEFDNFELIEVKGETLSETSIRERR